MAANSTNPLLSARSASTIIGPPKEPFRPYAKVHEEPKGAGDARPTALQVVQDEGLIGKLQGKVYFITGAGGGIGAETTKALHATGADVYFTVRPEKREQGEKVAKDILSTGSGQGKVEVIPLDLGSFASIKAGAEDFLSKSKTLNGLILNAGVMCTPKGKTVDGFETQIGTNHFGHFYLFQLLKEALLASSTPDFQSRVLVVSSAGHRTSGIRFDDINWEKGEYNPMEAYGQSKTANIYMATSIERHYGSKGLHGLSAHPGGILETGIGRHQDLSVFKTDPKMMALLPNFKSLEQGAATTVWGILTKRYNDRGGVFLGDVGEAVPWGPQHTAGSAAYVPHAYDAEAEERLWQLSCDAVGVKSD
jgi:NAD(P)-dependent dehydrogenase (short-subunit alcohol dehydrogenase family)